METAKSATVTVSVDGMTATLLMPKGVKLEPASLHDLIVAAGVVWGVDQGACARACQATPAGPIVIARGTPPVAGHDAAFAPAFESGLLPGRAREDGSLDFHERELVKSVSPGDVLGTLTPPRRGRPGHRVDGKPVEASDGRPSTMAFGPGVSIDPLGVATATRAGVVVLRAGASLDVTDGHLHDGDVDLRSGNLHVQGSVTVRGSVTRGCGVRATGDVEVRDAVDGGTVRAGGNAKVGGTVRGGAAAIVWAEGDVALRTAESAVVYAWGTLRVVEALSSRLQGKRVEVTRRVRGGVTLAEGALVASEAGAPDGTDTRLVAGEPLDRSLGEMIAAVQAAKRDRDIKRSGGSADRSAREKREKAGRMQAAASAVQARERIRAAETRELLARAASIRVTGTAYPGVVVQIGNARHAIATEVRGATFTFNTESRSIETERISR